MTDKVRDSVRLHPSTVTDYKKHVQKYRAPTAQGMEYVRVNSLVWQTAMRLAGGDVARLMVRSSEEVVVLNHAKLKKHRSSQS